MKVSQANLFVYRAEFVRMYDADTLRLSIDLGFGVWLCNQAVRLYGIDAWEVRGPEREKGLAAKAFAEELILGQEIYIRSHQDRKGKYGRWLAEVFIVSPSSKTVDLGAELVANGHAVIAEY